MQHRTNTFFAALSWMRFGFVALHIPSDVHPGASPGFGKWNCFLNSLGISACSLPLFFVLSSIKTYRKKVIWAPLIHKSNQHRWQQRNFSFPFLKMFLNDVWVKWWSTFLIWYCLVVMSSDIFFRLPSCISKNFSQWTDSGLAFSSLEVELFSHGFNKQCFCAVAAPEMFFGTGRGF